MSRKPTAAELREQRKQRKREQESRPSEEAVGPEDGNAPPAVIDPPAWPVIAQGRAEAMMKLDDLPSIVDAPEDVTGPLTAEELERWEACQSSFRQFRDAWWVFAKALEIALRGRLWRADYATAKEFIADVAGMSTSNAYRQIAGAGIAEILAGQNAFELESNDQSRMRDSEQTAPEDIEQPPAPLIISQRAADALGAVREDYGTEVAAGAYRAVAEVTGQHTVSGKIITGIVSQLPRRAEEELDQHELLDRVRKLAQPDRGDSGADGSTVTTGAKRQEEQGNPLKRFTQFVNLARDFANDTSGMAAAYAEAETANPEAAKKLAKRLERHMKRATQNFPDV
ncbi:hypothetical protein [Streptomyces kronopolitis]|uniref:hypothetical protein n=1 Tax=Streptomyces kronopolitis TaxID=1612435 RepID=UPI0036AD4C4A